MTKQMGLVALLLMALFAVGCGEVGKCKLYEAGCLGGGTLADGTCKAGLVPRNGYCIDPDSDCGCSGKELCGSDGLGCVNYCEFASNAPEEVPLPPTCRKADGAQWVVYDFENACRAACMQRCRRNEVFCPGFQCDPKSCEGPAVLAACKIEVQALQADATNDLCKSASDALCITKLCEQARDRDCNAYTCPGDTKKDCNGVKCQNRCGSGNNADGFCDDGDPLSASYALCDYGSDCSDCGPRRGERAEIAPIGAACVFDVGCEGWAADFVDTASWCLHVGGAPTDQNSCVPNCTSEYVDQCCQDVDGAIECDESCEINKSRHRGCSPGYECTALTLAGDNSPFLDPRTGIQGHACLPTVCE